MCEIDSIPIATLQRISGGVEMSSASLRRYTVIQFVVGAATGAAMMFGGLGATGHLKFGKPKD
jgi:hypothetical protein